MYTENDDEYVYISKDGVLFFYYDEDDFSLCKYPSESERTVYETPLYVTGIEEGAFARCKNLRKLIINSYWLKCCAILDCPNLETLVFKVQWASDRRSNSFELNGNPIIANCPKLQDIYLYCEEPENMNDLFSQVKGLENIVLHVPCFCAKKYREHLNIPYTEIYAAKCHLPPLTEEAIRQYNEEHPPAWRRFKRIEEFDPADVFGDEIIEFF